MDFHKIGRVSVRVLACFSLLMVTCSGSPRRVISLPALSFTQPRLIQPALFYPHMGGWLCVWFVLLFNCCNVSSLFLGTWRPAVSPFWAHVNRLLSLNLLKPSSRDFCQTTLIYGYSAPPVPSTPARMEEGVLTCYSLSLPFSGGFFCN